MAATVAYGCPLDLTRVMSLGAEIVSGAAFTNPAQAGEDAFVILGWGMPKILGLPVAVGAALAMDAKLTADEQAALTDLAAKIQDAKDTPAAVAASAAVGAKGDFFRRLMELMPLIIQIIKQFGA